jgi:2-aminoadipate transaminase
VLIVADEPYAALRFRGAPVRPLAAHSDRVISLGTVSKTLAPGLRLGWMIGPSDVIDAVVRLKQAVDLHTSGLSQQVVLHLPRRREWFDAHLAAITACYRERAAALRDALERELGSRVSISDPDGGMFLWLTSRPDTAPLDTRALLPLAIQAGTAFVPGGAFAVDEPLAAGRRPHSDRCASRSPRRRPPSSRWRHGALRVRSISSTGDPGRG